MNKLILFCLFFCVTALQAQFKNPFFKTISIENGLPEDNVQTPLQDKPGYMWFNTQNGLVRYDGYLLKPYAMQDNQGKLLVTSVVSVLFEDREGKLWAAVNHEGLYYLDRQKDAFIKATIDAQGINTLNDLTITNWFQDKEKDIYFLFSVNANDNKFHVLVFDNLLHTIEDYCAGCVGRNFIPAYFSADIKQDITGNIWLIADSLLSCFDNATKSFSPVFTGPDKSKLVYFFELSPDPMDVDIVWLMTGLLEAYPSANSRKLVRFNNKIKTYKLFDPVKNEEGSINDNCMHFFTDSMKRFWVSTEKGISLYNRQEETFTNYPINNLPRRANNGKTHIETLAADKEGNLWMSGMFPGIFYFDTKTAQVNYYTHNEAAGSFPVNNYGTDKLFFDRTGTLWAKMPYSGMAWLDTKSSLFNPSPISPGANDMKAAFSKAPYDVVGAYGDSIFLVRDTNKIFLWNYIENKFSGVNLKNATAAKRLTCTLKTHDGLIWIGSYGLGLFSYDPKTKAVKNFQHEPRNPNSLASGEINVLTEDKQGNLWIGTDDAGLCYMDRKSEKFKCYPFMLNNGLTKAGNTLDDIIVYSLLFDKDDILWIGTSKGGLNRLDTKTNQFTSFLDYKAGLNCVTSIFEDSHQRFWAGTYLSGLFLIDKKKGILKRYAENSGLLYTAINGITEDKAGNIWIASPRGLAVLNSSTDRFTNYFILLGVFSFHSNKIFRDAGYHFHVAVNNGVISFDPGQMYDSKTAPRVFIESVSYHVSAGGSKQKDTSVYINEMRAIKLKYNENRITIQCVALHYADAEANQYAYQLEGYDKEWIKNGTQRFITYTNLSPGNYTFHVRAANSNGLWNEAGAEIIISILPPWWRTSLAYCMYILLVGGSIWTFTRYRSRTLRKENIILEQKVDHRTKQLQESIETIKATQSQLIQSEKMASLGELTAGIAHEIQNPLNFVNNFSEVSVELIAELKSEKLKPEADRDDQLQVDLLNDITQNLEKINHHGKRADAIVKGMLQHSRSSGAVKEPTDINKLADEYLRLAYHGLRAKDNSFNAILKTNFDESIGSINIIPQDIGRAILNLITNAFYAAPLPPEGGFPDPDYKHEPTVWLSTKKTADKVLISVRDNGNGIPAKILDKIFQPFFTTKPTGQGTGLGLSLAYDIIKAHGGELKVETKEGEGTEFIITLQP